MTSKQVVQRYLLLGALTKFGTGLHFAVYAAFLVHHGLNKLEINLVNLVFFSTLFLFEIPTGTFADVYGRKASYLVSNLIIAIGLFMYGFGETTLWFMIAEVMLAVGLTFSTGAFEAWAVDALRESGEADQSKLFSKEQQIASLVGLFAGFIGAYFASRVFSLPWVIGSAVYLLTGILASFLMKENWKRKESVPILSQVKEMASVAKEGMRFTFSSFAVRFIVIAGFLQFFALMAPNMQWQLLFGDKGFDTQGLGYIWAGIAFSVMVGARLAPRYLKALKRNERLALTISQISIALLLILTVVLGSLPVVFTVFFLHEVARGLYGPVKTAYLHDNIPSKIRATIVSFESIANHFGGALGLLVSGLLAYYGSITLSWVIAAIALLIGSIALMSSYKNKTAPSTEGLTA